MSDIEDYLSTDDSDTMSSTDSEEEEIITKQPIHLKQDSEYVSDDDVEELNDDPDDLILEDDDSVIMDEEDDEDDDIEDEENLYDEDGTISGGALKEKTMKKSVKKPIVPIALEDSDDEESTDDNYLQKFDQEIKKNYVQEHHPECIIHNYEEVKALSQIVRDSNNIIIDPLHRTLPFLTKYEKARILGQRAKQIEAGAKPFVKVPENMIDGYLIASIELQEK
jgi:hypothetical protein